MKSTNRSSTIREKKHRLPREFYQGKVAGVFTLCIGGNLPFFKDSRMVDRCVKILEETISPSGCIVPVYCFMPDHLHILLLGVKDDADLWTAVVRFKQKTGFHLKKYYRQFHWQKDFYDHIIRKNENLITQIKYILENPVRKGLVNSWDDYSFKGSIGIDLKDVLQGTIKW